MIKQFRITIGILAGLFIAQNTQAALFSTSFDTYDSPLLNAVDYFSESRPMSSFITYGHLYYEDTDGTGSMTISSSSTAFGDMVIDAATLTTNNDGSLHVSGVIDFLDLESSSSFIGDMSVTANWNEFDDVTIFEFSPIAFSGSNHDGLFMLDGPLAGNLLEFHVSSSLLAYVDNPFPTYSAVPVPAAIWLFGSGLIGLVGLVRRKKS